MISSPTLRRRLMCMVYESFLLLAVIFIAGGMFDILTNSRDARILHHTRQALLFVVIGAYFIVFWHKSGQTLAMKTWRIKLVAADGSKPPLLRLVLRYLLCWLWFLPALGLSALLHLPMRHSSALVAAGFVLWALLAFTDPQRRFLHDRLAGTRLELLPHIDASKEAQFSD